MLAGWSMATMGTMLLRGVLPLSSSDLRRLVIRSKSPEGGGGRASSDSLRSALPAGLRAWILETGDGLEIICKVMVAPPFSSLRASRGCF